MIAREWQRAALAAWDEKQRGIVEVVTGGGKTVFALLCVERFWARYPDGNVVVVVPTTALADQWHVSGQEDLGMTASEIAVFSGQERPKRRSRFNIAVLNTARSAAPEIQRGAPSFLIVDECHRAATPANANALRGDYVATLGLSATPARQYDDGLEQHLIPRLGPIIFSYTYADAFRDRVITPFSLINVRVELLDPEIERIERINQRIHRASHLLAKTGDDTLLKRLLQRRAAYSASAAMRVPVGAHLLDQHRGERAIIFHERISSAEKMALLLGARHHSVGLYHSGIAPNVRRDNLRLFRKGVFDVLVSCRALDEGMNVPETAVAIVASSTASERQRIQRLGRVLRPAKGKDGALIYTLYALKSEEQRLVEEAATIGRFASVTWKHSRLKGDA